LIGDFNSLVRCFLCSGWISSVFSGALVQERIEKDKRAMANIVAKLFITKC